MIREGAQTNLYRPDFYFPVARHGLHAAIWNVVRNRSVNFQETVTKTPFFLLLLIIRFAQESLFLSVHYHDVSATSFVAAALRSFSNVDLFFDPLGLPIFLEEFAVFSFAFVFLFFDPLGLPGPRFTVSLTGSV